MIQKIISQLFKSEFNIRLYGNLLWLISGALLSKVIFFIALIYAANILGKVHYGEFGMLNSTILMFVSVTSIGMGATASRYIAEYRNISPEKTIDIFLITQIFSHIIAFVSSVFIFWFADSISYHSFHSTQLGDEIRVSTIIFFFTIINGSQNGVLSGFERFNFIAYSNIVKAFFQTVFLVFGAYYNHLMGALIGLAIAQFIANIYNQILIAPLIRTYNIKLSDRLKKLSLKQFNVLWKFSLPTFLSSLMIVPVTWYAKTKLVQIEGFKSLANFDAAEQWRSQILYIPALLSQIILPMLSNLKSNTTKDEYFKSIKMNLRINIVVSVLLSFLVILFAPQLLLLYGKDFDNTTPIYLLCVSVVFTAISNVIYPIILTYNKIWNGVLIIGVWALSFIILSNELLNRGYGENGLALAVAVSYALMLSIQAVYCTYLIKTNKWNEN